MTRVKIPTPVIDASSKPDSRPRWGWGIGLLAAWCLLEPLIWFGLDPDRTMQMLFSWVLFFVTLAAIAVWWVGFSRCSKTTRIRGGLAAVGVVAVPALFIRIDSYSGAFAPNFAFRWSPTRQELAQEYWGQQAARRSPKLPMNDVRADESLIDPDDDWPEFRGRLRDGIVRRGSLKSDAGKLPDWELRPPRQIWRHPIGGGMGSFAVVNRRAVTIEQRGDDEAVVCYDFDTGRELWSHRAPAHYDTVAAGEGPRSTPTIADGCVYAMGALGRLRCLELETGQQIWMRDTLADSGAANPIYGTAVSPLVFSNLVVVNPGGDQNKGVIAYNAETGKIVWSKGNGMAEYVSPQQAKLCGTNQLLIYDGLGPKGLQPQTGVELWRYDWSNVPKIHCSQPLVIDENHVMISSGYGRGSVLLHVEQSSSGWECKPVWTSRDMKLKFNPGVLFEGHVYGIDEGILACIELKEGRRRWKGGRYGFGQTLLVEDLLLVQAENGDLAVVAAEPNSYREITRFTALNGKTWNIPVLVRGRLLLRNEAEAVCYELNP